MRYFEDMTYSRKEIIEKMLGKSKQWIRNLNNVVGDPTNRAVRHWLTEMWGWWDDCSDLVMKKTNKRVSWRLFYDYFLTTRVFEHLDKFNYEEFNNSLEEDYENNSLTVESLYVKIKEHTYGFK